MSEIYLLANNPTLDISLIKNINNSTVCHFNLAIHRKHSKNSNKNLLMMGLYTKDGGGYFGADRIKFDYDEYYFLCPPSFFGKSPWGDVIAKFSNPIIIGNNENWRSNYTETKYPSIGYHAIKYFSDTFEKIYLIGFTFSGWDGHDWELEKECASNNKKVFLL